MAGSGKSSLMQRIGAHVASTQTPSYLVNLDPAVSKVQFKANIDIRDALNYKEVMRQYNLGPNGGILTSLNLFATRFDQVVGYVDKRAPNIKYVFADTPGQIEVFNWSASGMIITESLASTYPTVVLYVVDTPQSQNTTTFMSNMLYACSLFYKTKLPLILAFTKTDIVSHQFAIDWMKDFDTFDAACNNKDSYMSNFVQSMGLMIGEFYDNFPCVGVSSLTGEGIEDLFDAIQTGARHYEEGYKVDLENARKQKEEKEALRQEKELEKVRADLEEATIAIDATVPKKSTK